MRDSLAINTSAALIGPNNEQPHIIAPVQITADSQNNRLARVTYARDVHDVTPTISDFYLGSDMWDCVAYKQYVIASERGTNSVVMLDAAGKLVEVLIDGGDASPFGKMDGRKAVRTASIERAREAITVFPEGLYVDEEADELYIGSLAQQAIRVVNINTRAIVRTIDVPVDGNSAFIKFAVSNGTFGPRGTVAVCTAGIGGNFQAPMVIRPDGTRWNFDYAVYKRTCAGWGHGVIYPSAVALGPQGMAYGGTSKGIMLIDARRGGDEVPTAQVLAGFEEYKARGLEFLHGPDGYGQAGAPAPFGVSANIDAYLRHVGHSR